jgi:hypothetical protein
MINKNGSGCEETSNNLCNNNNQVNPIASCLLSLPPKQFSLLSSILGIFLIDNLNLNQQNALGNFIVNIGQAILTAASQGQSLQSNNSQNDHIRQQIQKLKKQISSLEEEMNNQN